MYIKGSIECIENSKRLLQNAELLHEHESYGVAQSLAILALEEAGKAVILDLASLGFVTKKVVRHSMYNHTIKKIITLGINNANFLIGKELINARALDIKDIKLLELTGELKELEKKRQNGLYVEVNSENGDIISTPLNINSKKALFIIEQVKVYQKICETLCQIFRDLKKRPKSSLSIMKVLDS